MRRLNAISTIRRFLTARDGATSIEYAIIASGIAGALIVTIGVLGARVATMWTSIAGIFN